MLGNNDLGPGEQGDLSGKLHVFETMFAHNVFLSKTLAEGIDVGNTSPLSASRHPHDAKLFMWLASVDHQDILPPLQSLQLFDSVLQPILHQ